jgi:rod shape-determining protein MreB
MGRSLAIDIGSTRTRTCARGGVVVEAPSRDPRTGRPVVADGVVVDEAAAGRLARWIVPRSWWTRSPVVVASCPLHVDEARPRLEQALHLAGAREVEVIPSMVAAAAGAGVDITSGYADMVVDVGARLTEIAVFRDAALLHGETIPTGADSLELARKVFAAWRRLTEDVQVEVIESGLVLTGGGALVPAVVEALEAVTHLTVRVPDEPAHAVIRGLARLAFGPVLTERA